jgi:hypothetical protein
MADLHSVDDHPLTEIALALRIAWYAPSIGKTLRGSGERSSVGKSQTDQRDLQSALRRYQLRRQAGRLFALTPFAMVLAFLGGFLLQTIAAPTWSSYAFVIALSAGTVMQILLRGAGLPRPGVPRGKPMDIDIPARPGRSSGEHHVAAARQRL